MYTEHSLSHCSWNPSESALSTTAALNFPQPTVSGIKYVVLQLVGKQKNESEHFLWFKKLAYMAHTTSMTKGKAYLSSARLSFLSYLGVVWQHKSIKVPNGSGSVLPQAIKLLTCWQTHSFSILWNATMLLFTQALYWYLKMPGTYTCNPFAACYNHAFNWY